MRWWCRCSSSAIPTSPLAWTMGAVCHRRGFPFLPPSNILAYGVKIAAIVVVVVAVVVACNHVQADSDELFWCSAIRTQD